MAVRNGILTANTVATISVAAPTHSCVVVQTYLTNKEHHNYRDSWTEVELLNVDGADAMYFRTDNVAPTVGGNDCHAVPAVAGASLKVPVETYTGSIKIISAGTPKYSAELR